MVLGETYVEIKAGHYAFVYSLGRVYLLCSVSLILITPLEPKYFYLKTKNGVRGV